MDKITNIFTTAKPVGVAVRDATLAIGSILTVLGTLGVLTPQDAQDIIKSIDVISGQVPILVAAVGVVMAAGVSIYRIVTKSSSDKAANIARQVDAKVPVNVPVTGLQTPAGSPDVPIAPAAK